MEAGQMPDLNKLSETVAKLEESHNMFQRVVYASLGVYFTVMSAMAGQVLVMSGRENAVIERLREHSDRMTFMLASGERRDGKIDADLSEIRADIKSLIRKEGVLHP